MLEVARCGVAELNLACTIDMVEDGGSAINSVATRKLLRPLQNLVSLGKSFFLP